MFRDVLVATDRHDVAEETVRYRSTRWRRFFERLRGIALELIYPTGGTALGRGAGEAGVDLQHEHATRHAIDLASSWGARLHVLFTVDAVRYDTTVEFATEPLVEEGEEAVDTIVAAAERAGLEATGSVEVGRPSALVLGYADEHDVDLIVLNARNPGGLRSLLRGDLVSTVIEGASVPVYVVPRIQPGHPD